MTTPESPRAFGAISPRRARFKAARVPVDANGKPTGPPTEFLYDESGKFIEAKPAEPAEDS